MNWLKYKKIYFSISLILVVVSVFSLLKWGFELGVDFKGGSVIEYKFEESISTEELSKKLVEENIDVRAIQESGDNLYILKLGEVTSEKKNDITEVVSSFSGEKFLETRFETVGPSIGPELIKKTIYAILVAAGVILIWVAIQFKDIKYGASAILAMFHDTLILVGVFSLLGHFLKVEIDFLFVTALLTTLSFSVHDTIVVFDRIREIKKKSDDNLVDISNTALSETMIRSLNNSFTIIFMLVALVLLGGSTVKWFAVALLVGTVMGTYSSPFVAVPLLNVFFDRGKK